MKRANFFTLNKRHLPLTQVSHINILCIIVFLLIVLSFAGCKTSGSEFPGPNLSSTRPSPLSQKIDGGGWISIFLNLDQPRGPEISFEITSVELQANEQKHSLLPAPLIVNSKSIGSGQLFIARNSLSANNYTTLSLGLRNVAIAGQIQKPGVTNDDIVVEMKLPSRLNLMEGDSHSLFITWNVISSIDTTAEFSPEMNVSLQAIPFLSDLLYVACPEIDTIYAVRTDKNWVISSLGVVGGPTYMALDLASDRLYVLTPGKSSIQVIDLVTNKIIDNIFMPLDYQSSFMIVSSDKRYAYVLVEQGRNLLKVDLSSGSIENRIALSFQPRYAAYLEWQRKLAVSSFDTNAVYLFDPDSLINSGMVPVGTSPEGLFFWNNLLLVAESDQNLVSSYDLYTNQKKATVNVGFSPRRFLLSNNQIYVTNFASKSISYTLPGQLNISGEIFLQGKPLELATSESRLWIYAGDGERGGLHVIDSTSNRRSSFIDLQALPAGLAVID